MSPTTLRLATANAASGVDRHRGRSDMRAWAAAAADLDVDVLAVQEVDHLLPRTGAVDQTAQIAAALGVAAPAEDAAPWTARFAAAVHGSPGSRRSMRPAPATDLAEPSYGIALFSRHPVAEWRELRLAPSRTRLPVPLPPGAGPPVLWVPDEQRVALAAVLETPAGPATVVTTHLSFAPVRAAAQLRRVAAWAADLPRPLVLLGDLNLPGRMPARLTGWTPALRAATYPARRPRVQLDHLLLDAGATGARLRRAQAQRVGGSDHLALRAELVWPGAGAERSG